jgi:hypothetical protein
MSRLRLLGAIGFALVSASACGSGGGVKDEELEGLVLAPPAEATAVAIDRAVKESGELARAFALPHHEVAKKLGAHTVKITSRYEVKEGDKVVDQLSDTTTIELGAGESFRAVYENSADYGREVIFEGGHLFLRPRYSKWHRRAPNEPAEPAHTRDQMYAVLGDYFAVVAHAAEVTDKGPAKAAGRDGRRVEIKLDPTPAKPAAQVLTQRKWRESVTVQALEGDAVLDADSAAPLQARFKATFTFSRDGRTFTQTLEVGQEVTGVGSAVALVTPPPEEVVVTPERSHEVDERDELLKGMAPPSRRQAEGAVTVPEETAPSAPQDPSRSKE